MAKKEKGHGGGGRSAEECERMQNTFAEKAVEGALAGEPLGRAIEAAGYAPTVRPAQMLTPESATAKKLQKALEEKGIDENWLIDKHMRLVKEIEGGNEAFSKGAMAYNQSLKQIAHLLGHGAKHAPSVAVQINNPAPATSVGIEPGSLARLAELVEQELSRREPGEVPGSPAGDPGL